MMTTLLAWFYDWWLTEFLLLRLFGVIIWLLCLCAKVLDFFSGFIVLSRFTLKLWILHLINRRIRFFVRILQFCCRLLLILCEWRTFFHIKQTYKGVIFANLVKISSGSKFVILHAVRTLKNPSFRLVKILDALFTVGMPTSKHFRNKIVTVPIV